MGRFFFSHLRGRGALCLSSYLTATSLKVNFLKKGLRSAEAFRNENGSGADYLDERARGGTLRLGRTALGGYVKVAVGEVGQLEKITGGAAGQIGDLLSKCSERAFFPRFSSFFVVVSEKDEEVPVGRGGSCEMILGMCGTPSRTGGDMHSVGTPVKHQAW